MALRLCTPTLRMPAASTTRGPKSLLAAVALVLVAGGGLWVYLAPRSGAAGQSSQAAVPLPINTDGSGSTPGEAEALSEADEGRVVIGAGASQGAGKGRVQHFGEVVIAVKARDGHTPVAGAVVWTVPSHSEVLTTGRDGRVTFQAESNAILAGVESAHGYLLWDPSREVDGSPGEVGSVLDQEVPVAPEATTEIELFVRLGATIRGTLLDPDGLPLPRTIFYMAEADGSEWLRGEQQRTDDNGAFHMVGLRPNWYLLGPDPRTFDVFPYEHVRADWGTTHEATLQMIAPRPVSFEVAPEGLGPSDAWPLTLHYKVVRDDRMEFSAPRSRRALPEAFRTLRLNEPETRGPVTVERELSPGPYRLNVVVSTVVPSRPRFANWLGSGWRRSLPFTVDALGMATFPGASPPDRAVLKGLDQIAFLSIAVTGARSAIWIQAERPDSDTLVYPSEDENGRRSVHVVVDLADLGTDELVLREKVQREEPTPPLGKVTLVPGLNEHSVHLLGATTESK